MENAVGINDSQIKSRHHCWKVLEFVKFGYGTCKGDSLSLIQEYLEYNYTDFEWFHSYFQLLISKIKKRQWLFSF